MGVVKVEPEPLAHIDESGEMVAASPREDVLGKTDIKRNNLAGLENLLGFPENRVAVSASKLQIRFGVLYFVAQEQCSEAV